ncbi:MAG: NADH-quinone oxidoreductase subunit J [Phycisphaerales bacterium]|nr:NADH-quinone oxidoreductase subunit J [Phycisphaerales bacterium]
MIAGGLIVMLTIAGALIAIAQGNIVRAIFGLGVALAGVALAFLALGSPFVAAMEVLIYIGGITVAMVFAVMLSSAGRKEPAAPISRHLMAGLIALAFFVGVAIVITGAEFASPSEPASEAAWSVAELGRHLLNRFNVVFEALSVVLLLAIIGAIAIARRDEPEEVAP